MASTDSSSQPKVDKGRDWLARSLAELHEIARRQDDDDSLVHLLDRVRRALGAARAVLIRVDGSSDDRTLAESGAPIDPAASQSVLRVSLERDAETLVLECACEGAGEFGRDERAFAETALSMSALHLDRVTNQRQQRVFRALVENSSDHVSLIDRSADVLFESPAIERLFGWRVGEISDPRKSLEMLHPDDRQRIIEEFFALTAAPFATRTVTYRLRTPTGEYRHVEAIWRNLIDDPGVQGVCVSARDITDRVLGDVALRESEARYRALFDHFPDALLLYARDRLVLANTAAVSLLGTDPSKVLGREFLAWVDGDERAAIRAKLLESVRAESVRPIETSLVRDDGGVSPVEIFGLSMRWHGTEAVAVVVRDIRERKALTLRLMEVDRIFAIGTLAAGIGHEINNPLAYVVLNLEVLASRLREMSTRLGSAPSAAVAELSGPLTVARGVLDDVQDGARRIRNIVRELKAFSRSGTVPFAPVDLGRVARSALTLVGNEVRSRADLVVTETDVPRVSGDEGRLVQLVINLLSNAAQAFPPERRTAAARIELRVSHADGTVVVEVADNGVGISPEVRARIFDPFFTTKPPTVGTGLGLTICQQIALSHDGRIDVESEPGVGTTVRVSFPAVRAKDAGAGVVSVPAPVAGGDRVDEPRRVLVVDDDPQVAMALVRVLSDTHRVEAVARCDEALERIRAGARYDAILCDVMMRGMSGTELHAALVRESPESAGALAFVTGGAFNSAERAAIEATHCPVFEKPVDGERLRAFVAGRSGATA